MEQEVNLPSKELLETLTPAAKAANRFWALTQIAALQKRIEELRRYL